MAKTKKQKEKILEKYLEKLSSSKIVVVVQHSNLKAIEINELKKSLYQFNTTINVIKNRLTVSYTHLTLPTIYSV